MDDLGRFVAEMRALACAEAVIECEKFKITEERLAANPELRQAAIEHFHREALRYAAQEDI